MGVPVAQVNSALGKKLLPLFPFDLPNAGELPETPGLTPSPCLLLLSPWFDGSICSPAASPLWRRGYLDPWSERESQHFVFPQSSASKWAHEKE